VEIANEGPVAMLAGSGCAATPAAPGSLRVRLPALGYAVCAIGKNE
jgi:hypothetical protein